MGLHPGVVIPSTPIAVDKWSYHPDVRLFFLTHMHADHTAGITPSWNLGKIYCSEVSRTLLLDKFAIAPDLVIPMEVGEKRIVPLDEAGSVTMTVTPIDANHCPGAVMFLFEGYFGTVLCTGDFRYTPAMLEVLSRKTIDHLYLDNTYCNPACIFPGRERAASDVIKLVKANLDKEIVIGIDSLGKEELLVQVAVECRRRIFVSPIRLGWYRLLGLPDVFTTDLEETNIQVWMKQEVTNARMEAENLHGPCIAILPSALFGFRSSLTRSSDTPASSSNIFLVPYSNHSSYAELLEFVTRLKPRAVTPLLLTPDLDVYKYIPAASPPQNRCLLSDIPPSVRALMGGESADCIAKPMDLTERVAAVLRRSSSASASLSGASHSTHAQGPASWMVRHSSHPKIGARRSTGVVLGSTSFSLASSLPSSPPVRPSAACAPFRTESDIDSENEQEAAASHTAISPLAKRASLEGQENLGPALFSGPALLSRSLPQRTRKSVFDDLPLPPQQPQAPLARVLPSSAASVARQPSSALVEEDVAFIAAIPPSGEKMSTRKLPSSFLGRYPHLQQDASNEAHNLAPSLLQQSERFLLPSFPRPQAASAPVDFLPPPGKTSPGPAAVATEDERSPRDALPLPVPPTSQPPTTSSIASPFAGGVGPLPCMPLPAPALSTSVKLPLVIIDHETPQRSKSSLSLLYPDGRRVHKTLLE